MTYLGRRHPVDAIGPPVARSRGGASRTGSRICFFKRGRPAFRTSASFRTTAWDIDMCSSFSSSSRAVAVNHGLLASCFSDCTIRTPRRREGCPRPVASPCSTEWSMGLRPAQGDENGFCSAPLSMETPPSPLSSRADPDFLLRGTRDGQVCSSH
jgi:hypothetical protein